MNALPLLTAADRQDQLAWEEMLEIAPLLDGAVGQSWCLIGAQMVRMHAAIAGAEAPRISRDLDLLGNERARTGATKAIADVLGLRRFLPIGPTQFNTVHRFERGEGHEAIVIDVLGPDNLGSRARPRTYGAATTLAVPGGTFALATASTVALELQRLDGEKRRGQVRLPSLAGAIGIKAEAIGISNAPNAQLDDLLLLLSVVDDPQAMRAAPNGRKLAKMLRPYAHRITERAGQDDRSLDARATLVVLTDP